MSDQKVIMVIDDEEDLLDMVSFQLEAKGYKVFTACDGQDGLEKLNDINPDLIILDLNMPKMGGIEFYNEICEGDQKPRFPVMILTARANTEELFTSFAIDGFMAKPFEIDALVAKAEEILKNRDRDNIKNIKLGPQKSKSVFIAEDNPEEFKKIALALLNAGYIVNSAKTGTAAINKIIADVPNLVLINLGLKDISGDIVVTRLARMPQTEKINYVLYCLRSAEHQKPVLGQIGDKTGIVKMIEYDDPVELVDTVDGIFKAIGK